MVKWLVGVAASASLLTTSASAQMAMTDAQKRLQVVPLIRALTNCIAETALSDSAAALAYREGTFNAYVVRLMPRCPSFVNDLSQVYERVYGPGETTIFLDGAYANDLPRSVLKRIRPQLEVKADQLKREEADRAARQAEEDRIEDARRQQAAIALAEENRRAEAERQRQAALAEQQAATAKAAAAQADAEAKAAIAKAEAERLQRVSEAKKAEGLLVDRAADCARRELKSLVRSGESAETLATAVMTICGSEVDHVLTAGVDEYKLEHQIADGADFADGVLRERLKADAREQVVALAVQAKAGVGSFAPASSN